MLSMATSSIQCDPGLILAQSARSEQQKRPLEDMEIVPTRVTRPRNGTGDKQSTHKGEDEISSRQACPPPRSDAVMPTPTSAWTALSRHNKLAVKVDNDEIPILDRRPSTIAVHSHPALTHRQTKSVSAQNPQALAASSRKASVISTATADDSDAESDLEAAHNGDMSGFTNHSASRYQHEWGSPYSMTKGLNQALWDSNVHLPRDIIPPQQLASCLERILDLGDEALSSQSDSVVDEIKQAAAQVLEDTHDSPGAQPFFPASALHSPQQSAAYNDTIQKLLSGLGSQYDRNNMLSIDKSRTWSAWCFPKPVDAIGQLSPVDQQSFQWITLPAPALNVGFGTAAFGDSELAQIKHVAATHNDTYVYEKELQRFPFLTAEYPPFSDMYNALLHVQRDAAAACHTLYKATRHLGPDSTFKDRLPITFSVIVVSEDDNLFVHIWAHWRHVKDEQASFEICHIFSGFLTFAQHIRTARAILENIIKWKMEEELPVFKQDLRAAHAWRLAGERVADSSTAAMVNHA